LYNLPVIGFEILDASKKLRIALICFLEGFSNFMLRLESQKKK